MRPCVYVHVYLYMLVGWLGGQPTVLHGCNVRANTCAAFTFHDSVRNSSIENEPPCEYELYSSKKKLRPVYCAEQQRSNREATTEKQRREPISENLQTPPTRRCLRSGASPPPSLRHALDEPPQTPRAHLPPHPAFLSFVLPPVAPVTLETQVATAPQGLNQRCRPSK